ncbi:MAG TPA: pseudouridine synthase [Polyangiaceae bacterium]
MTAQSPGAPSEHLDCPHAARCSGCALWEKSYGEQLELKRAAVVRAAAAYTELGAPAIEPTQAATPTVGYRVRSKLAVSGQGELGLFARGSHEVVDVPDCRVLAPALSRVTAVLRELIRGTALLHAVDLRVVDRGVLVTLVVPDGSPTLPAEELAQELARRAPDVVGVALSTHRAKSPLLLGVEPRVLSGSDREPHHVTADAPYELVSHGSFTQAHLGQAARLHARIERTLRERGARRVLELYAGSCSLALRLSARGFDVTAVEAFAPALKHGELAAHEQKLAFSALGGTAQRVASELAARGERFDAVVVNPPRAGLTPDVRRALSTLQASLLVYVSCQPETLARDLSHLALLGFQLNELAPFDMIPQSDAVEALAIASRGPVPAPTVIHADDALIAVIKSGYEPVAPTGEHAHALLARVRSLPRAEGAIPAGRLELGTSGVCLFARTPRALPEVLSALAAGKQTYLALARGVTHEKGRIARALKDGASAEKACTRYVRDSVCGTHSLLRVQPEQPRAQQIHRHLASIGHPLLGDARHGHAPSNRHFEQRYGLDRSFLHCARIELSHSGNALTLEAPLAPELARVLDALQNTDSQPAASQRQQ